MALKDSLPTVPESKPAADQLPSGPSALRTPPSALRLSVPPICWKSWIGDRKAEGALGSDRQPAALRHRWEASLSGHEEQTGTALGGQRGSIVPRDRPTMPVLPV